MKSFSLVVLAVASLVPALAQEVIFYDDFEGGDTSGWWAPARVGETGQETCYDAGGTVIPCAGTGQDGDLRPGVEWPNPRFVDNGDGTVTDMLTGLVWLKNANCLGERTWVDALADANTLGSGACGLTDGSVAGDWHLPSVKEIESLFDYQHYHPPLSNAAGTGQWSDGDAFSGVQVNDYWSSSSSATNPSYAWDVDLYDWKVNTAPKSWSNYVWPVRQGIEPGGWAPARVSETGEVTCFDEAGTAIPCAGTDQDGDLRPGVAWPNPRFVDNGDGTVKDMLTGLVWLKNANCFGFGNWTTALTSAATLASGGCGLTDGSVAGDWRLPSEKELQSLVDYQFCDPALSNAGGTGQWSNGDAFSAVQINDYWSSSSHTADGRAAYAVYLGTGGTGPNVKEGWGSVWPVRGVR